MAQCIETAKLRELFEQAECPAVAMLIHLLPQHDIRYIEFRDEQTSEVVMLLGSYDGTVSPIDTLSQIAARLSALPQAAKAHLERYCAQTVRQMLADISKENEIVLSRIQKPRP